MAGLSAILVLVTTSVVLVVSLIAMELLLIGHEKLPFLVPVGQFTLSETSSTNAGRISLS